jgi:hypothetical protein
VSRAALFHDLITVPQINRGGGIYWLRLYAPVSGRVAVVTEVPGNPGRSVMNASEAIFEEIGRRFEIDNASLTSYIVMPGGFTEAARKAWRVSVLPDLRWDEVTIRDIEGLVGHPLEPIPDHRELFGRVLSLGGDPDDELHEPVFEAVRVEDLPSPHLPSRCALADRFRAMKATQRDEGGGLADAALVGARFLESLTADDRATCPFHAADWLSIAAESVRMVDSSPSADQDGLVAKAEASGLPPVERRWLASLFRAPVVVYEDGFGDGQHRGCALRFSGASRAVVVREFKTTRVEPRVWIYAGDG